MPILLFGPLVFTTVLAKLAAPAGPREIPLSLYLILGLLVLGIVTSQLRFDLKRLVAFAIMTSALGAVQVLRGEAWSLPSFLMMASLYACYTVSTLAPQWDVRRGMSFFLDLSLVIALAGIAQFFLQFVIGPQLAFPVDYLVPKHWLVEGYMNLNVLQYGSTTHKPNGIFLLEASFFSQLLAIAVLAELLSHNRIGRLLVYGVGMMVAYSGTGILILLATLPFLVLLKRRWDLVLLGLLGLVVALVLYEPLNLDLFVKRATEFNSTRSSGFERFVGAKYFFEQYLWTDPWRSLFGYGAGMMKTYEEQANLPVHESALTKIVFEFGIVGALLNIGFLFFCVSRSSAPAILKLGVAVMFFMAGIYTPSSHGIALTIMMWPSPAREPIVAERRGQRLMAWLGLVNRGAARRANAHSSATASSRVAGACVATASVPTSPADPAPTS